MYMPFAHTDFIFPMIGEELGGRVTLSVVLIFVLILVFGFRSPILHRIGLESCWGLG